MKTNVSRAVTYPHIISVIGVNLRRSLVEYVRQFVANQTIRGIVGPVFHSVNADARKLINRSIAWQLLTKG